MYQSRITSGKNDGSVHMQITRMTRRLVVIRVVLLRHIWIARIHVFVDFLTIARNADFVVARRQFCPQSVADQIVHCGFGLLLVSPVIQLSNFGFHLGQEIHRHLLDLLNILLGQVVGKQQIIGKRQN